MSHFALLWKARAIERYRRNYEREKYLSLEPEEPKNLFQRLRRCRYRFKKKFKRIFINVFPKHLLNFFVYVRTDQTFANFILKSIVGFLGGCVLTYVFFMFLVFQLSISLVYATVMCSVIGVLLTLGLAFSYRVRCLVFLLFPQFFSEVGRYTLIGYALILILTGPAKNTLHNSEVLSESMACGQEQLKTNVRQIKESIARPFNSMKDTIQLMVESVKVVAADVKKTLMSINRMVLSIVNVIQSALNWLGSIVSVCNKKMGSPSERCHTALQDGVLDCQARLGAYFSWLCNVTYVAKVACDAAKVLDAMCVLVDFVNNTVVATIKRKLKTFSNHVKTMLYVSVRVHHEYSFNTNSSKSASQVAAGIVTEIRHRADRFLQWFSWMSCITSLFLLIIVFRAKYYQYMYLGRMRYDNRYLTRPFRELDLRRARESRDTVLPLNRRERAEIVTTTSFRLVACERRNLARSTVFLSITTLKLLVHMAVDYSLYWVLKTVRYHGRFEQPPILPDTDGGVVVTGSGMVAMMLRGIASALVAPLKVLPVITPVSCLPEPSPPDTDRNLQIGILIVLVWALLLLQPYGLRLRHVVMDHYRPERARARAVWLYNHILRKRGGFLRLARRKMHRDLKMHSEDRYTFRQWLDSIIPCGWLRALLRTGGGEDRCVLCGVAEDPHDPDTQLIRCETPGCQGVYCVSCYEDIGRLCTACLTPADYGDVSDISLEKGSSEESDNVADTQAIASADDTQSEKDTSDENDENRRLMKNNKREKRNGESNKRADGKNSKCSWLPRLFEKLQRNNRNTENEQKNHGTVNQVGIVNVNSSTEYDTDDPLLEGSRGDNKYVNCFWKNKNSNCYGGDCTESSSRDGYVNVDGILGNSSSSTCLCKICKSSSSRGRRKKSPKRKMRAAVNSAEGIYDCICKEFNDIEHYRSQSRSPSNCEVSSECTCLCHNTKISRRKNERRSKCKVRYSSTEDETVSRHLSNCNNNTREIEEKIMKDKCQNTYNEKYTSLNLRPTYESSKIKMKQRKLKDTSLNTPTNASSRCKMKEKKLKNAFLNINNEETSWNNLHPPCECSQSKPNQKKLKGVCNKTDNDEKSWKVLPQTSGICQRKLEKKKRKDDRVKTDDNGKSWKQLLPTFKSSTRKMEQRELREKHLKTNDKILQHKRRAYCETMKQQMNKKVSHEFIKDSSICSKCKENYHSSDDSIERLKEERYEAVEKHRRLTMEPRVGKKKSNCRKLKEFLCKNKVTDCECPDCVPNSCPWFRQMQESLNISARKRRKRILLRRRKKSGKTKTVTPCPYCRTRTSNNACKKCKKHLSKCLPKKREKKIFSKKCIFPATSSACKQYDENLNTIWKNSRNSKKFTNTPLKGKSTPNECIPSCYKASSSNPDKDTLLSCLKKTKKQTRWKKFLCKLRSKRKTRYRRQYSKTKHKSHTNINPAYDFDPHIQTEEVVTPNHRKLSGLVPEKLKLGREFKVVRPKAEWNIPHRAPINRRRAEKADVDKDILTEIYAREMGFELADEESRYKQLIAATNKLKSIAKKNKETKDLKNELNQVEATAPAPAVGPWVSNYEWPKMLESPKCLCPEDVCTCGARKENVSTDDIGIIYDDLPKMSLKPAEMVQPRWSMSNIKMCLKGFLKRKKNEPNPLAGEGTVIPMLERAVAAETKKCKDADQLSIDCLAHCHKYYDPPEEGDNQDDYVERLKEVEKSGDDERRKKLILLRRKLTEKLDKDRGNRGRSVLDEASIQDLLNELCGPPDARRYGSTQTSVQADDDIDDFKIDIEPICPKVTCMKKGAVKLKKELCFADETTPVGRRQIKTLDGTPLNIEVLDCGTNCKQEPEKDPKKLEQLKCLCNNAPQCEDGVLNRLKSCASKVLGLGRTPTLADRKKTITSRMEMNLKMDKVDNKCQNEKYGYQVPGHEDEKCEEIPNHDNLIRLDTEDYTKSPWSKEPQLWMDHDTIVFRAPRELNQSIDKSTYCRPRTRHNRGDSPRHHRGDSLRHHQGDSPRHHRGDSLKLHRSDSPILRRSDSPKHHQGDSPRYNQGAFPRPHRSISPRQHRSDSPNHRCESPRYHRDDFPRQRRGDSPRRNRGDLLRYHQDASPRQRRGDSPRNHRGDSPRHHQGDSPRHHQGDSPRHHQGDSKHRCEERNKICSYSINKGTQFDCQKIKIIKKNIELGKAHHRSFKSEYREARRKVEIREADMERRTNRRDCSCRQILEQEFLEKSFVGCQREFDIKRRELHEKNKRDKRDRWQEEWEEQSRKQNRYSQREESKKNTYVNEKGYITQNADPSRMAHNEGQRNLNRDRRDYGPDSSYGRTFHYNSAAFDARRANVGTKLANWSTGHTQMELHAPAGGLLVSATSDFQEFEPKKTSSPAEKKRFQNDETMINDASLIPPTFNCGFFEMLHESLPVEEAAKISEESYDIHNACSEIHESSLTESQQRDETSKDLFETSTGPGQLGAGKKSSNATFYTYIKRKFTKAGRSTQGHGENSSGRSLVPASILPSLPESKSGRLSAPLSIRHVPTTRELDRPLTSPDVVPSSTSRELERPLTIPDLDRWIYC